MFIPNIPTRDQLKWFGNEYVLYYKSCLYGYLTIVAWPRKQKLPKNIKHYFWLATWNVMKLTLCITFIVRHFWLT